MNQLRANGFLALVLLLSLAACGGGGGDAPPGADQPGADTLSITATGGTTTTYTQAWIGTTGSTGYDPDIIGTLKPSDLHSIVLYADFHSSPTPQYSVVFSLEVTSATATTVPVTYLDINYMVSNVGNFWSTGNSGTVTFTRIDNAVGGRIQGSFNNVEMRDYAQSIVTTLSGTFNATISSVQ